MSLSLQEIKPFHPDLPKMHAWKNDPQTLAFSFAQNTLSWEAFCEGFELKYASLKALPPQWILLDEEKVGVLYFEPWFREKGVEISIFLNPAYKNQQIGSKALQLAAQSAFNKGFEEIVAFVQTANRGAQKAFEKAGFSSKGSVELKKYNKTHNPLKYSLLKRKSSQVFIIAEAGSNFHVGSPEEDLLQAKQLIVQAYQAGANAVKFQLYDAQSVYAFKAGSPGYLDQDIHTIFQEYALDPLFIPKLSRYAHFLGIEFMCSAFSVPHFEHIDPYVERHKIASYEIRHVRLLESAAQSKKPLILSTGASTLDDIRWAIDTFKKAGGEELTLMQCSAQYPAQYEALNLNCIPALREQFQLPVGFSDHSDHPVYAPLMAVALGAQAIEKHFTFDRRAKGPDHCFALEYSELKEMVDAIRAGEKMLGVAKKEIFPQEEELAHFARRSLQALKPIEPGERFIEGQNVGILRSGNRTAGLHPKFLNQLIELKAKRAIEKGAGIERVDVLWD